MQKPATAKYTKKKKYDQKQNFTVSGQQFPIVTWNNLAHTLFLNPVSM